MGLQFLYLNFTWSTYDAITVPTVLQNPYEWSRYAQDLC